MHSIRRAAARAACSSSAVAVPRQQIASFAMQISKTNARPAAVLPLARHFSQTMRVAQDEKSAVEEAIGAAAHTGSTMESSSSAANPNLKCQIYISNMTFDVTESHLRDAFGKYGEILDHKIGRDGRGLSRGFGFVTFDSPEAAQRAIDEANQSFWHGRRINVQPRKAEGTMTNDRTRQQHQSRDGPEGPTKSLYIGNIPYETSDSDLNKMFRELDNVVDVRVAIDRNTGWPRGFAHADFADVASAEKAFEKLSTLSLGGRTLRIDYSQSRQNTRRPGLDQGE
ncbi:RNA-binding domain-containing protein [Hypoxylon sp. FL1150]|nr:RNA-binding domain-containing protein [Hypoxylon sp. FL1150]